MEVMPIIDLYFKKVYNMTSAVDIELYYYPKDRLFTDLDGFEIPGYLSILGSV